MSKRRRYFLPCKLDLLNVVVASSLLLLIITHLFSGYEDWRIRQRVSESVEKSILAQHLVQKNFFKGISLDHGWADLCPNCNQSIGIDGRTGIITIRLEGDIDGGGKSLILLPVHGPGNDQLLLEYDALKSKAPQSSSILWLCTSSGTRSTISIILKNKGSLRSKFAPYECRFLPKQYSNLSY